jgi:peptide/nickel transport system permease protein
VSGLVARRRSDRHAAVYRRLLVAYPWAFRREFGPEMAQVFRTHLDAERRTRGRLGVAACWARAVIDLARSATRERVEGLLGFRLRDLADGGRSGMFRYMLRRLLFAVPVMLIASVLVFVVIRTTIDPIAGYAQNPRVQVSDLDAMRKAWGLDQPLYVQYVKWLAKFVSGDWGTSLLSNRPVFPEIRSALANTLVLGVTATALSLLVGIGIGMYSALRRYSFFDHASTGAAFVGLSIPNFWFALLLQIFFGLYLTRWLHLGEPIFFTAGMYKPGSLSFDLVDRIRHMVLPILVLSVQEIAVYSRYMRSSMLEVLQADYLRTARAKGIRERRLVMRHAFRNALIPITTVASISIGAIAGGLIITESIFQWPGMGALFVSSLGRGDYLIVLPWLMVTVSFVIFFNLVADIMYAVLDPRIRYG